MCMFTVYIYIYIFIYIFHFKFNYMITFVLCVLLLVCINCCMRAGCGGACNYALVQGSLCNRQVPIKPSVPPSSTLRERRGLLVHGVVELALKSRRSLYWPSGHSASNVCARACWHLLLPCTCAWRWWVYLTYTHIYIYIYIFIYLFMYIYIYVMCAVQWRCRICAMRIRYKNNGFNNYSRFSIYFSRFFYYIYIYIYIYIYLCFFVFFYFF